MDPQLEQVVAQLLAAPSLEGYEAFAELLKPNTMKVHNSAPALVQILPRILTIFRRDLNVLTDPDTLKQALRAFGYLTHDTTIGTSFTESQVGEAVNFLTTLILNTPELGKQACNLAMWVFSVQSFAAPVTEKFLFPILSSVEVGLRREESSTIQLEAVGVVGRLATQTQGMKDYLGLWFPWLYSRILSTNPKLDKVRDKAEQVLISALNNLNVIPVELSQNVLKDCWESLRRQMKTLMRSREEQEKNELCAVRAWGYFIKLINDQLFADPQKNIVNKMLKITEMAFLSTSSATKIATFNSWKCLMDSFSLIGKANSEESPFTLHISPKRMGLLMMPILNCVAKESDVAVQETALECLSHLISTVIGHEKMHLALDSTLQPVLVLLATPGKSQFTSSSRKLFYDMITTTVKTIPRRKTEFMAFTKLFISLLNTEPLEALSISTNKKLPSPHLSEYNANLQSLVEVAGELFTACFANPDTGAYSTISLSLEMTITYFTSLTLKWNHLHLCSLAIIGHPILEWVEANQQARNQYRPILENLFDAIFSCLDTLWQGSFNESLFRGVIFPFLTAGLRHKSSKKVYNITFNFWTNHFAGGNIGGKNSSASNGFSREELETIQALISESKSSVSSPVKRLNTTVLPDFLDSESLGGYLKKGSLNDSDENSASPEKKKRKPNNHDEGNGKDLAPLVIQQSPSHSPIAKSMSNNISRLSQNNSNSESNNNSNNSNNYVKIEKKPSDLFRIKTESQIEKEREKKKENLDAFIVAGTGDHEAVEEMEVIGHDNSSNTTHHLSMKNNSAHAKESDAYLGVTKVDYAEWIGRLAAHPQWSTMSHQQLVDAGMILQRLSGEVFERLASWSGKG